jgi:hypothetical protein
LFDTVIHHLVEGRAFIYVGPRMSNVTELTDDFDAVFNGPLDDTCTLELDRIVLLALR